MGKWVAFTFLVCAWGAGASETADILKQAKKGDLKALNQAFVLHSKTDGGDAEDIDIAIGKSITRNPKNFLTALKQNHSKVSSLSAVVGNLGPACVDDLENQRAELERRLAAIQTVDDDSLKKVRAECETELKHMVDKRSSAAPSACPIRVTLGKFIEPKKVKSLRFKKQFCFETDRDDLVTESTPLDEVKHKLFCTSSARMDKGKWYLSCAGLDLEVKGKPSAYSIVGLRIHPEEPGSL